MLFVVALFIYSSTIGLEDIKSTADKTQSWVEGHWLSAAALFFITYAITCVLSLPHATLLSLLGGTLFGGLWGTVLVSTASTVGATIAFLMSRKWLQNWVRRRFHKWLPKILTTFEKEGDLYLLSLRLIPLVPFFMVNFAMGLTGISTIRYTLISFLGMLPGTIVYVNAGRHLKQIESTKDLLSPNLILSFCLLAIFPLLMKFTVSRFFQKKKGLSS